MKVLGVAPYGVRGSARWGTVAAAGLAAGLSLDILKPQAANGFL
ncbi:hypothetical protein [Pseudomonas sp. ICMP 460]|nr:hypothetical protein [Pseudomonas sp. ICMP 460]